MPSGTAEVYNLFVSEKIGSGEKCLRTKLLTRLAAICQVYYFLEPISEEWEGEEKGACGRPKQRSQEGMY